MEIGRKGWGWPNYIRAVNYKNLRFITFSATDPFFFLHEEASPVSCVSIDRQREKTCEVKGDTVTLSFSHHYRVQSSHKTLEVIFVLFCAACLDNLLFQIFTYFVSVFAESPSTPHPSNPVVIKSLTWMVQGYGYLEVWDTFMAADFGLKKSTAGRLRQQWRGWSVGVRMWKNGKGCCGRRVGERFSLIIVRYC